ncbi:hypothetical protein [Caulobacter sp. FWC2]|uniref:hypothetical protein n=1 Tax=Caulobacter sp. FWC2 TaxID=69664 RepID=UPI000C15B9E4|nr:hypothetical protein [Caulobacter sp. FWC2]PIB92135.1 hypothetical protein CSW62_11480 [Caulobacter sp. FWC2]
MLPPDLPVHHTDLFIPHYQPLEQGDWRIGVAAMALLRGYWSPPALVTEMVCLTRRGQTWMSTSPMELESQEIGVRLSGGHVLIYGLGMGWSALNCALREEVEAVTVVELDPDVLALHRTLDLAAQLPASARAKLRIVQGDAYAYVPDRPVDLLMPDIWLPFMNETRVQEVAAMQEKVQARHIYFWGQELEIALRARKAGLALDRAGVSAIVSQMGLPLLGPALPTYPETVRQIAEAHLDRLSAGLAMATA